MKEPHFAKFDRRSLPPSSIWRFLPRVGRRSAPDLAPREHTPAGPARFRPEIRRVICPVGVLPWFNPPDKRATRRRETGLQHRERGPAHRRGGVRAVMPPSAPSAVRLRGFRALSRRGSAIRDHRPTTSPRAAARSRHSTPIAAAGRAAPSLIPPPRPADSPCGLRSASAELRPKRLRSLGVFRHRKAGEVAAAGR